MSGPVERGEVELYGVRYRVLGPIQRVPVAPFPQKITIGDYSRDDEVVASSWVQTSWTGGLGIETGTYPRDQDRFWYSTLDTRWPRTLGLGPYIYRVASPDPGETPRLARYGGAVVVALGAELLELRTGGALHPLKTYPGPITDLVVSDGLLWVAGPGFDVERWDGETFTTETGERGVHLADLGGWLYLMDADGSLRVRRGGEGVWEDAGAFPHTEPGWVSQLLVYTRPDGDWALYAVAADGLWVYDPDTLRFFPTQVTWPPGLPRGRACVWRGEVYVPVGASLYRWGGQTLVGTGPDRDEGLPRELADRLVAVYPAHGFLVAVLSGRADPLQPQTSLGEAQATGGLRAGNPLTGRGVFGVASRPQTTSPIEQDLRRETVLLATSGDAWHVLAAEDGGNARPIGVAEAEGKLMVLWHRADHLRWVLLPPALYNPLRPAVVETQATGELVTPWFDAGWAEIDKAALRLKLRVEQASPETYIEAFYQVDADRTWHRLGRASQPGEAEWEMSQVFRRIRLRLTFHRTTSYRFTSPVVSSIALSFLRRPPTRYGFQFTIDLSQSWRGRSPTQLRDTLLAAAETQLTGSFAYADDPGSPRRVVISRLQFAQSGGLDQFEGSPGSLGRAAVSVIEV